MNNSPKRRIPNRQIRSIRSSPKRRSLNRRSPKRRSPKSRSPKRRSPKRRSPKRRSPKSRSPKRRSPKSRSPKRRSPKRRSPKSRSPKRRSPKSRSPKPRSPKRNKILSRSIRRSRNIQYNKKSLKGGGKKDQTCNLCHGDLPVKIWKSGSWVDNPEGETKPGKIGWVHKQIFPDVSKKCKDRQEKNRREEEQARIEQERIIKKQLIFDKIAHAQRKRLEVVSATEKIKILKTQIQTLEQKLEKQLTLTTRYPTRQLSNGTFNKALEKIKEKLEKIQDIKKNAEKELKEIKDEEETKIRELINEIEPGVDERKIRLERRNKQLELIQEQARIKETEEITEAEKSRLDEIINELGQSEELDPIESALQKYRSDDLEEETDSKSLDEDGDFFNFRNALALTPAQKKILKQEKINRQSYKNYSNNILKDTIQSNKVLYTSKGRYKIHYSADSINRKIIHQHYPTKNSIEIHCTSFRPADDPNSSNGFYGHVSLYIYRNTLFPEIYHYGVYLPENNLLPGNETRKFWSGSGWVNIPGNKLITLNDKTNIEFLFPPHNDAFKFMKEYFQWCIKSCPQGPKDKPTPQRKGGTYKDLTYWGEE
jgi:hypothetical protein